MAHKKNTRKMTNPYILDGILQSIDYNIKNAQLPKEFNFNNAEKTEFMKDVYRDTLFDLIDMLNEAPFGAIPTIRTFYPIKKGN